VIRDLVRLYPRWWRDRYGAELDDLTEQLLADGRPRWRVAGDLLRGAADARLQGGQAMLRSYRGAVGVGACYGLAVAAILSTVFYLGNIVYATTKDTDGIEVLFGWAGVFAILGLAGQHAARRFREPLAPMIAGAVAGCIVALSIGVTFLILDNVYLDIIGQQEQKIAALANAGGGDMRAFLNQEVLRMFVLLVPVLTLIGAGLGHVAGLLAQRRSAVRP
jgi:hypothetical protein